VTRRLPKLAQAPLAWAAVVLVWLQAGAIGVWIGLDLGRALFD
jgi:hypothetical protein